MLNLRYIDLASLVQGHDEVEEVADLILELNTDNQAKEILEGQRRYREQMATMQAMQKKVEQQQKQYEGQIDELQTTISTLTQTHEDDQKTIADKDATIAALQAEIERLKNEKK